MRCDVSDLNSFLVKTYLTISSAGGKQLYDAVSCLFGRCPKPPQVTITTLTGTTTQEYKLKSTFPKNGLVFYDSKATVLCADCYIDVSSFKVEGKVVIVAK